MYVYLCFWIYKTTQQEWNILFQQFEIILDSLLETITITKISQSTKTGTFVPRLRTIVYRFGLDLGF